MATRCCCPPDRADTGRFSKPFRFTVSSISITRRWISASGIFTFRPVWSALGMRRPKATFSNTLRWGNRAYRWNTVFTARWWGGTSFILTPSNKTSPAVGDRNPPMIRSVVVLPHPLGPSSVRNSLSLIYRLMWSSTTSSP